MSTTLKIGLFGFGVVGEGIYRVLQENHTLNASIKKICIRHHHKKRSAPAELFTTNADDILNDDEINVVVELIDDATAAYDICRRALLNGKSVVSANKKMIAENLQALLQLQQQCAGSLLYEAAVCGSIPIIRNLEEYYDTDRFDDLTGIVNGSTNFILSKMEASALSYQTALHQAQANGFAEADPTLDVSGRDAVNKLAILLVHAYGITASPDDILYKGIDALHADDLKMAARKNSRIKLIASAVRLADNTIATHVLPTLVSPGHPCYAVQDEFNGVAVTGRLAGQQFLYGRGAGRYPTSSAVLSDIAALRYGYRYAYRKKNDKQSLLLSGDHYLKIYVSFDQRNRVNSHDFEQIHEAYYSESRSHIVGLIQYRKLQQATWLKEESLSVIALADPIVERDVVVTRHLKNWSLQLAGVEGEWPGMGHAHLQRQKVLKFFQGENAAIAFSSQLLT